MDRIKVCSNAWPVLYDVKSGVIPYLKKFVNKTIVVLGKDDILPIVKDEEKIVTLVFDALINGKTLVINMDEFKVNPGALFVYLRSNNIMDAGKFLDPTNLTKLGDRYPKICQQAILERYKYSDSKDIPLGLIDNGMVLCFVTSATEKPDWAEGLNNLSIF